ncbi:MAG TPA: ribonuclease P protein component [Chitinophagaceae bacterium]
MKTSGFRFGKQEKLKRRKVIGQVFAEGKAINAHPLRLVYLRTVDMNCPVKAGVTVSTRNFKKAVERNRIKRLVREAYRLNKPRLLDHLTGKGHQLAVFFIYTGKDLPSFTELNEKMQVILNKLIRANSEAATENS